MTMNDEERQARRMRCALEHALPDIPPAAARRLEAARHLALSRQKQPEHQWQTAGAGASPVAPPSRFQLKQALAAGALLLGMWLSFHWHSERYVAEVVAVDSALLAGELPPEVLLDKDFLAWLQDDSAEE